MKKTVSVEQEFCDACQAEASSWNKCLNCGTAFCYDCLKIRAKKYSHGVYFGGTGDGTYCLDCDAKLRKSRASNRHNTYVEIESLRHEQNGWYASFKERADAAEAKLAKLLP